MLVDAVPAFALLASRVACARFYSCEWIKIYNMINGIPQMIVNYRNSQQVEAS